MKKLLLYLVILLFFNIKTNAQSFTQQYNNEIPYIIWTQQYQTLNCYPSFYWSVTRTNIFNQYGQELYKMYFYSNSRYCNGSWAATYITGISLYINDNILNKNEKYWVIFKDTYHHSAFSFWSYPNPKVVITWDNVTLN
jgi:hypothetical protein